MQRLPSQVNSMLSLIVAGIFATCAGCVVYPHDDRNDRSARYDPYEHPHDPGYDRRNSDKSYRDRDGAGVQIRGYFTDRHRAIIQAYYAEQFRAGRCPPGLAKKHNGCLPPGQAKKWRVGQPLPRDVIIYDLPPRLIIDLGKPPAGYRYARVASDILLIAIATAIIVDAIE